MTQVIGVAPGEDVTLTLNSDGSTTLHRDGVESALNETPVPIAVEDRKRDGYVRCKWLTAGTRVWARVEQDSFGFCDYDMIPRQVREIVVNEDDCELRYEDEPGRFYRYSRCFEFELVSD